MDGEPLEGAEVVFAPMEIENQAKVGPASVGMTDSNGVFTLKTIRGTNGAVATNHKVSVSFGELDEAAVAAKVDEVYQKNRNMSESEFMNLERKIRRSMKNPKSIPETYNRKTILKMEIQGATEKANFALLSDGT